MNDTREKARRIFRDYTDAYDASDTKVWLKIEHSLKVCELSADIAGSLDMSEADVELAWMIGLLHDIGRFEQLKRYGTFLDAKSLDHAELSADILFIDGLIEKFDTAALPDDWRELSENAIRLHNKLSLPDDLRGRKKVFADIIRDADKVDIFRVLAEIPYEKRANYEDPPERDFAREEVMVCVREHRCVPRILERSKFESLISQCCMAFELVYEKSRMLVCKQGNLKRMIEKAIGDANEQELAQLDLLRKELSIVFERDIYYAKGITSET